MGLCWRLSLVMKAVSSIHTVRLRAVEGQEYQNPERASTGVGVGVGEENLDWPTIPQKCH